MLRIERLDKRALKYRFLREVFIIYVTTLRPISYLLCGDENKVVLVFLSGHAMFEIQGNSETIWPKSFM